MPGLVGRSNPGISFIGELAPEGTREEMVGLRGGGRGSSSSIVLKRSLMLLARERVLRGWPPLPLTGEAVLERDSG